MRTAASTSSIFIVRSGAVWLPFSSLFGGLARFALLWPPVYLDASLCRMYADRPARTAVKVALLGSLHLLAILDRGGDGRRAGFLFGGEVIG